MVDVSGKPVTAREAVARGRIHIAPAALKIARAGKLPKGGIIEVARPGRHARGQAHRGGDSPLPSPPPHRTWTSRSDRGATASTSRATVRTDARTGAEMEALHAVAVAALTVYDMVKAADKGMTISDIRLIRKTGGRRGAYVRPR
jgi:cyclic pyranopterin phosphate synthase